MRIMHIATVVIAVQLAAQVAANTILIKGGTVVNHDQKFKADVLVEGELIKAVGPSLETPWGAKVIDASGKYVMPGGIDPHTHLEMPFMGSVACDDFFSGQAAAAAGGTTMHIDFALPVDHDLEAGFNAWTEKAKKGCIDFGFHMAVTKWNEKTYKDMGTLAEKGINSFKFFMAYKGALMVSDEELIKGFSRCKELGAVPQVHAENGDAVACGQEQMVAKGIMVPEGHAKSRSAVLEGEVHAENGDAVAWGQEQMVAKGIMGPEGHAKSRPAVLEGEATARAIKLAKFVNAPLYVVHVMSIDALNEVARARQEGQRVVGEPVVSGLALNESWMWHPDFDVAARYVMSPPIRSAEHGVALKKALANNVLQLVATDHAVFNSTQKSNGRNDFRLIPNGVNGIEERMHVVWDEMVNSGLMSVQDYVRVTSTAAAQIFNVYPRKGYLAPGSDADIIVLDPNEIHTISAATHHSRMDSNVFEGRTIKGKVVVTVSRGRVLWEGGKLLATEGSSRYIPLPAFGPLYDGLDIRGAQQEKKWNADNLAVHMEGAGGAKSSKDEL
eukprot:gene16372-22574_t